MAGVDAFTPIINWPECAVLGIGQITREPVVQAENVVVGDRLWLSLTFDHRIVDGAARRAIFWKRCDSGSSVLERTELMERRGTPVNSDRCRGTCGIREARD